MKSTTKIIQVVCLIAAIWIVIQTVADMGVTDFHVVTSSEYIRDGQKCIMYRVYADKEDMTEKELIASFDKLIRKLHDGYYLHDVLVYSKKEYAYGAEAYDVANVEEIEKGQTPIVEFSNYTISPKK